LFDLGLIGIDLSHRVVVAEVLRKTVYGAFDGQKMHLPADRNCSPNSDLLEKHRRSFGL